jgi:hypothetical protein
MVRITDRGAVLKTWALYECSVPMTHIKHDWTLAMVSDRVLSEPIEPGWSATVTSPDYGVGRPLPDN